MMRNDNILHFNDSEVRILWIEDNCCPRSQSSPLYGLPLRKRTINIQHIRTGRRYLGTNVTISDEGIILFNLHNPIDGFGRVCIMKAEGKS